MNVVEHYRGSVLTRTFPAELPFEVSSALNQQSSMNKDKPPTFASMVSKPASGSRTADMDTSSQDIASKHPQQPTSASQIPIPTQTEEGEVVAVDDQAPTSLVREESGMETGLDEVSKEPPVHPTPTTTLPIALPMPFAKSKILEHSPPNSPQRDKRALSPEEIEEANQVKKPALNAFSALMSPNTYSPSSRGRGGGGGRGGGRGGGGRGGRGGGGGSGSPSTSACSSPSTAKE
jgi:uncharacterized membrane protein YgcG